MNSLEKKQSSKITTQILREKILTDAKESKRGEFLSFLLGYIDSPEFPSSNDLHFRAKDEFIEKIVRKKLLENKIEHLWSGADNRIEIFSIQINTWFNKMKKTSKKEILYKNLLRGSFYARGFALLDGPKFHRIEFSCHNDFLKDNLVDNVFIPLGIAFSKNLLQRKAVYSIRQRDSVIDLLAFMGFGTQALIVLSDTITTNEERSSRWKSNIEINNEVKKMSSSKKQVEDIEKIRDLEWSKQDETTKLVWRARLENQDLSLSELTDYLNKNSQILISKSKVYRIIKKASVLKSNGS